MTKLGGMLSNLYHVNVVPKTMRKGQLSNGYNGRVP